MNHPSSFQLSIESGIAQLTIDCPEEKINKLSTSVMAELRILLTELSARTDIQVLLIGSAKPNIFIAGADISEIQDITDPTDGYQKAQNGQSVLNQLENLPFPTIALIDGACLGGGLEFALACTYRIVSDNPKVQLGLPEVSLGILPGFGGTQRLPRLIGLQQALTLILSGKAVDGPKAVKIHLADALYDSAFLLDKAKIFAQTLQKNGQKKTKRPVYSTRIIDQFLDHTWLGNQIVFAKSRTGIMKSTHGNYPAPIAALNVIKSTYNRRFQEGLNQEAHAFSQLVITPICKHLIQLFYTQESLKKDPGVVIPMASLPPIRRAATLGAGLMGGGISWLLSHNGIPVRMKDLNWEALTKGMESAAKINQKLIQIRKLAPNQANLNLHMISPTTHYNGFKQLDIVIEAVVENMEVKKSVFRELETHLRDDCIIATNTSALDITEMSECLKNPDRFVGMHFFSPVNRMPLVEVIAGKHTSPQTIAQIVALAKQCKKTPIVVQNCPGFLVNRILIPYVNEAVLLVQEGAEIKQIDRIMEAFGMPLGPLALADEVGLDVGYKVAKILENGYPDRMKTAKAFDIIHNDASTLGKKSKKGFYVYTHTSKTENIELRSRCLEIESTRPTLSESDILDRLVLIMVNEAARCLSEKIVASAEYLDMAMILGTGFPPFRGGLCRYADQIGNPSIVQRLLALQDRFGTRFSPASALQNQKGDTLYANFR